MTMLHRLAVLAGAVLVGLSLTATASAGANDDNDGPPGPATKFSDFLCNIDLADNGLNTTRYLTAPIEGGIVGTLDSDKLCTNSRSEEIVKISCSAQIPGWKGGRVTKRDVSCDVNVASCGVETTGGEPINTRKATLRIESNGRARLECEVKKRTGSR
jgi:hypothetical protein